MKFQALGIALLLTFLASQCSAQETTREDFKKYCEISQGRWGGEVTWVADFPGFGKKGEKVTAYAENWVVEDGSAMIMRFHGGQGSATGIIAYDPRTKRIRSQGVDSAGGFGRSVVSLENGKWVERGRGCLGDGTETTFTSTLTISDNGNTFTFTGPSTVGGKKVDEQHDVWHRLSKPVSSSAPVAATGSVTAESPAATSAAAAQDVLAQVQGKWTRNVEEQGKTYRMEKHITGNNEILSIYDGEKVVNQWKVEFTIAKSHEVTIFTYRNIQYTAGPNAGRKNAGPYSYLFQVRDNKWMEVQNMMNGDSGNLQFAVYERVTAKE